MKIASDLASEEWGWEICTDLFITEFLPRRKGSFFPPLSMFIVVFLFMFVMEFPHTCHKNQKTLVVAVEGPAGFPASAKTGWMLLIRHKTPVTRSFLLTGDKYVNPGVPHMARLGAPADTSTCRDQDFQGNLSACSHPETFHNSALLSSGGT